ncbi:MAG: hypothetical protein IPH72_30710 [Sandaracinaceae bacterium]|nr:hypothetical protein [Sandaracinaceae bacterium]
MTRSALVFTRLAPETGTPIVPVAVVGAGEQYVSVGTSKPLAKLPEGCPAFPIVPQLFVGMLAPRPKCRLYFGEPLHLEATQTTTTPSSGEGVDRMRTAIEYAQRGLEQREGVFF